MFVQRRSSKEQFTTMRDGKTENDPYPPQLYLTHLIFFKTGTSSGVALVYLPQHHESTSTIIQGISVDSSASVYYWPAAVVWSSVLPTHH